jgi:hypothetical protein
VLDDRLSSLSCPGAGGHDAVPAIVRTNVVLEHRLSSLSCPSAGGHDAVPAIVRTTSCSSAGGRNAAPAIYCTMIVRTNVVVEANGYAALP